MLIKSIDYPEELLEAQQSGNLVVFAGAGVSAPSPSGLPQFRGLANEIGVRCRQDREQKDNREDPDDRFLGRLAKEGVNVHALAATILVGPHSQPHELHLMLLRLFRSPGDVRLATTNFDTHFSTAAAKVFDSPVETFVAPALPLGDDFTGLVYLHGCADKDPKRCVLTDEDFGRAYLTRAWATRFLAAMFSKYTVPFKPNLTAYAINHSGGKLAEFWLQRGSVARKEAGDACTGIPPDISDQLKAILRSSSGAATHARVVFASRLAEEYPDATAALVLLYLRNPKDFFPPDEHVTHVWEALKRGGLARPKLLQIRDELARLGQDPGEP